MSTTLSLEARKAKRTAEASVSFAAFMERRETKLMLSMVPPAQQPEVLETLMRSAFDAGQGHGEGSLAGDMLGALLSGMEKDRKRGD